MQSECIELDYSIPLAERVGYILRKLPDPYRFTVGDISVRLSFTENSPSLQTRMCDLLCRKASG